MKKTGGLLAILLLFGSLAVFAEAAGDTFVSREFGITFRMPDENWQRAEGIANIPNGMVEYMHRESLANFAFFATETRRSPAAALEEAVSLLENRSFGVKIIEEQPLSFEGLEGKIIRLHTVNQYGLAYDGALVTVNSDTTQYSFYLFSLSSSYEDPRTLLQIILRSVTIQ